MQAVHHKAMAAKKLAAQMCAHRLSHRSNPGSGFRSEEDVERLARKAFREKQKRLKPKATDHRCPFRGTAVDKMWMDYFDVTPDDQDITGKPPKDKTNSGRDAAKRAAKVAAPDEGELGVGAGTGAEDEVDAALLDTVRQSGAVMQQVSARLAPAQGSVTDLMPNPAALTFIQSALSGGVLDAASSEIKDLAKALVASETSKALRLTRQNAPTNLTGANNSGANSNMDDEHEHEHE